MAVESWTERATGRVTEAALRLRQPARRFAGSVRSSVTVGAIVIGKKKIQIKTNKWKKISFWSIVLMFVHVFFVTIPSIDVLVTPLSLEATPFHVTASTPRRPSFPTVTVAYTLLVGTAFYHDPWRYREVYALLETSSVFAFLTAIMDIVLIFGLLVKEDKLLKYLLCACMALYLVAIPLSVCTFFAFAVLGYFDVPLWEIPQFGGCLLHLGLMYCLLSELRGDPLPPLSPPAAPAEGWLKNNLARTGPPAPTADDALLKVHVAHSDNANNNNNNNNNNNSNAQPRGPAVFAPSSCTTAPAVLPAYTAAPAPAAGPPSSTDA